MATTNRFGLEAFGAEGSISQNGYKFSHRDRLTMDALFWTLFNHDHRPTDHVDTLFGPQGRPVLSLDGGGTFSPGSNLYYRISYMDASGNETEASIASFVQTPAPIAPPDAPFLVSSLTGGSLDTAGTYRYALAYYQDGGKTTRAPNTSSIALGTTTQGTITVELPTIAADADGWHIYRRDPLSDDYYYIAAVAAPAAEFVDDGTYNPDCARKRPASNNTNGGQSVVIDLDPNDLPLDERVTAWRIYRSNTGTFLGQNLLVTVESTTTEGGTDLVTTYTDTGSSTVAGVPLDQTTVPPPVPVLDASEAFDPDGSYLPATIAPQGVQQFHTTLPGALADATTYNMTQPVYDMRLHRLDAFFLTAPTGADGSNYPIIRVKDDGTRNAIQSIYTDAVPIEEVHTFYTNATSGTFTLTFDGQTTAAINYNASSLDVANALENLSNITSVYVTGNGIASDPWVVRFFDPYVAPAPFTQNDSGLTGGTLTYNQTLAGGGGGTFTLTLDGQTTGTISWDADAATVTTALEALSNVTDVTVTGTGISTDPWVVEFVDPGAQDVPLMSGDPGNLNGSVYISETQSGYGPTTVELVCDDNLQYFSYEPGDATLVLLEAEDATLTGATEISDVSALNDVSVEMTGAGSVVWAVGALPAGSYSFYVYAAAPGGAEPMSILVSDLDAGGTLSGDVKSTSYIVNRGLYAPAFDVSFESTGTENIELAVTKAAGGAPLRVDRFAYEAYLPTFHGGATLEVEVEIVGAPSTPGSDVQLNLWY